MNGSVPARPPPAPEWRKHNSIYKENLLSALIALSIFIRNRYFLQYKFTVEKFFAVGGGDL
jgi:hypothetical protein